MTNISRTDKAAVLPRWKVLFFGLLQPSTYMRLDGSSPFGLPHFFRTFGLYCVLPMVLLNLVAILARGVFPDFWRFQDINPWTIVIALPIQFVLGPLKLWGLAWCMYAGMNVVGLNPASAKERVLTTGWYVGTTLLCLVYWWIGIGIFFGSLRALSRSADSAMGFWFVLGLAVWIRVAWSSYRVNLAEHTGGTGAKTFIGLAVGAGLFFLAMIPVSIVLKLFLYALL